MIKRQANTDLPTIYGDFEIIAYSDSEQDKMPQLALIHHLQNSTEVVNVRIHSECITGDVFASTRCDCGDQLHASLDYLSKNGGVLLYLRQEGRNIGIIEKLKAYNLQDEGMDTAQANIALGHQADERNYDMAIEMLNDLKIEKINLLTNNPDKINAFKNSGIEVVDRIPLEIAARPENENYLKTKKNYFGHLLDLNK